MNKQIIHVQQNETKVIFDIVTDDSKGSHIEVHLDGPNAKGYIYGIFIGEGDNQFDIVHKIVHNAPDTESEILVRGVMDGTSVASYDSVIKMNEGVHGAEGHQKEDTLLLSDKANINAVPNLEVAHNDVKCSHSVSTTNIDKDKLFFMNTRGIKTEDALKELVKGHFAPILDKMEDVQKQNMQNIIEEKFS